MDNNKKNIKDLEIWHYMKKVPQEEENKMSDSEKLNLLNDGWGNIYLPPDKGATDLYTLDGDDTFLYRYNFETKEIEAFVESELEGLKHYNLVESMGLNIGDFADGPSYWVNVFATELQDFFYQEAEQINQDIIAESYDEDLSDDVHVFEIKVNVSYNLPVEFMNEQSKLFEYKDKLNDYFKSLSKEITMFDETIKIDCSFDTISSTVTIKVASKLELTDNDLEEIYSEYEPLIKNPEIDFVDKNSSYSLSVVSVDTGRCY